MIWKKASAVSIAAVMGFLAGAPAGAFLAGTASLFEAAIS
jgi:hypothetical protein